MYVWHVAEFLSLSRRPNVAEDVAAADLKERGSHTSAHLCLLHSLRVASRCARSRAGRPGWKFLATRSTQGITGVAPALKRTPARHRVGCALVYAFASPVPPSLCPSSTGGTRGLDTSPKLQGNGATAGNRRRPRHCCPLACGCRLDQARGVGERGPQLCVRAALVHMPQQHL